MNSANEQPMRNYYHLFIGNAAFDAFVEMKAIGLPRMEIWIQCIIADATTNYSYFLNNRMVVCVCVCVSTQVLLTNTVFEINVPMRTTCAQLKCVYSSWSIKINVAFKRTPKKNKIAFCLCTFICTNAGGQAKSCKQTNKNLKNKTDIGQMLSSFSKGTVEK